MTWTDFNEYNSDVQFQIGQRIQKLRSRANIYMNL